MYKVLVIMVGVLLLMSASVVSCGGENEDAETPDYQYRPPVSADDEWTIEISGNDFVKFSGNILVRTSSGRTSSRTVDGQIPATYTVTGDYVSCTFQSKNEIGVMGVRIENKTKVKLAYESTHAAYGIVSVDQD